MNVCMYVCMWMYQPKERLVHRPPAVTKTSFLFPIDYAKSKKDIVINRCILADFSMFFLDL